VNTATVTESSRALLAPKADDQVEEADANGAGFAGSFTSVGDRPADAGGGRLGFNGS
jgi:hypothetical protein